VNEIIVIIVIIFTIVLFFSIIIISILIYLSLGYYLITWQNLDILSYYYYPEFSFKPIVTAWIFPYTAITLSHHILAFQCVKNPGAGAGASYRSYAFCCAQGLAWDEEHLTCKRDSYCNDSRDKCPNATTTSKQKYALIAIT